MYKRQIIRASKEPKKSIIDQAAKISKKLPAKKWATNFISKFEDNDKYNFFLGWGLSSDNFSIENRKESHAKSRPLCSKHRRVII